MTDKLIDFKKIEFEGSHHVRKEEYWNISGVKITIREEKEIDYTPEEIDCMKPEMLDKKSYWCTCKSCSVKSIPRGEEPKCIFVKSLKAYLKLKKFKGKIK